MQNQQQSQSLSFSQKAEIVRNLLIFPALTVMVFIRRNIGYRLVKPSRVLIMAFLVWMMSGLFQDPARGELNVFMVYYACAIVAFGIFHRVRAWWFIRRGNAWHTYDPGISGFESFFPRFVRGNRFVARFFDPLIAGLFGLFVSACISTVFGAWLIFSSFCLLFFELFVHENAVDRELDVSDGLIAAGFQSETAQHFEQSGNTARKMSKEGAIPTGLGTDIRKQVRGRRTDEK